MGNGSSSGDAVNKGQMDAADLLKMNSANGVGTGQMTLSHTTTQLKLVNTNTSTGGNLIKQSNLGATVDFWDTNSLTIAAISTNSFEKTLILSAGTLIKIIKPTQITGTLTMVAGGLSPIDMSGNTLKNLANSIVSGDAVNRSEIATSSIPLTAWRSGDVIQRVLKGNWLGQTTTNNTIGQGQVGGLSSALTSSIFYSFLFTPKSTTSIIYITFDGNCTMATGGNSADSFKSYIGTYNGVTTQDRMLHNTYTGSVGMRGTSCFPISATWNNTTTTEYTIGCYFDLQAADDTLTFTTQWSMKLEEIKI